MNSSTTSAPSTDLADELAALSRGEVRSWGLMGYLLDQAEKTSYWQSEARSFSAYVELLANRYGVKTGSLWRYLTAGRYYDELRQHYGGGQSALFPPLREVADAVSPEKLEILSKLSRVAPDDVMTALVLRVVRSEITRAELRAQWEAYRPVLAGRTARGDGVSPPRVDHADPDQAAQLGEANVAFTLLSAGSAWTGCIDPDLYEVFVELRVKAPSPMVFDFVALQRRTPDSALELHGIEVLSRLGRQNLTTKIRPLLPFFNFVWLALPEDAGPVPECTLPDFVGVLRVGQRGVTVERAAQISDKLGSEIATLTQALLVKSLGR